MRASKTHKVHLFAFASWYCHLGSQVHGECGDMPRSTLLETYLYAWPSAPETGATFAWSMLPPSPGYFRAIFCNICFLFWTKVVSFVPYMFPPSVLHFCFNFLFLPCNEQNIYRFKLKSRFFFYSHCFFFLKKELKSLNSSLNEQLKMEFS